MSTQDRNERFDKSAKTMGDLDYHAAANRPEKPLCSICIANYNGTALLRDCVDSILAQSGDINVEIIVHDDNSTDESVALLRDEYPQVEILASHQNVGFCVSNNRLVRHARGKYVLLLNNDAALCPDALVTLLSGSANLPAAILTLPQYDWLTGDLVDRGCLLDPFYNPVPNLDQKRSNVAMVIGACLWLPRTLWNELGGFPEWMESIAEDVYLCGQARLLGYAVRVLADSGYRHRQGQSFGGNRPTDGRLQSSLQRRRLSERNKTFALVVLTPTMLMWPLLVLHLTLLILEGVIISIVRRDATLLRHVYLGAPLALIRKRRALINIRKTTMDRRTATLSQYLEAFTLLPRKLSMLWRYGLPTVRH